MARCGTSAAGNGTLLWHPVAPPRRRRCLSVSTWNPLPGSDRAHAHWLRTRRLPAGLAHAVGLLSARSASGRPGDRRGLRRIRTPDRLSSGRQSIWPQPFAFGAASSVSAGYERRLVLLGTSPPIPGGNSRRRSIRLRRGVAGRISKRHLLAGDPPQCTSVPAVMRMSRTVYLVFDADTN